MTLIPAVCLVGVREPYDEAIETACEQRGVHCVSLDPDSLSLPRDLAPLSCIVRVRGDSEEGHELVKRACKLIAAPTVVLARDTGIDLAIRILRTRGVVDVLEFPAPPAELAARALAHLRETSTTNGSDEFVGETPPIAELREAAARAAASPSTVLLQGETGTGKGLIARMIHQQSSRADRPFVHVDCAALSPTLIESELFGHERGAFTGAESRRTGRFEAAGRGTIFLDEIGDLDGDLQTKLLRVLEDRSFERVGGVDTMHMHARVIAATSHDLHAAVADGRFRRDLYYRLNVLELQIPPLRDRPADIPALVAAGLDRLSEKLGVARPRVSDKTHDALCRHDWPGNVRELMNVLERLLVSRHVSIVEPEDLEGILRPAAVASGHRAMRQAADDEEAGRITSVLRDTAGNVTRTARLLGMPRGTLRDRIKRYGLEDHTA